MTKLPSVFYVYVIFRWNGIPVYVGKGKGKRSRTHFWKTHNDHLARIIAKSGGSLPLVIIRLDLTEEVAFEIERAFIAAIGRADQGKGPLVNLTDGGEGATNVSPESNNRRAQKLRDAYASGRKKNTLVPGIGTKAAAETNRGRHLSLSHRNAIGRAHKDVPKSGSSIEKMRAALRGRSPTEAARAKSRAAQLGVPKNHGPQISASLTGRSKTPEAVAASVAAKRVARQQRDEDGILPMKWWNTLSGEAYMAREPRDLNDLSGTGKEVLYSFIKSAVGTHWWHTPEGVLYRSVGPRDPQDLPGRRIK